MEHNRSPISTSIIGTQIDLESHSEIPTHINTLSRHRRPDLITVAPRRSQGIHITRNTGTPTRYQGRIGGGKRGFFNRTGWLDQQPGDRSTEVHGVHVVVGPPAESDRVIRAGVQISDVTGIEAIDGEHCARVDVGEEKIVLKLFRIKLAGVGGSRDAYDRASLFLVRKSTIGRGDLYVAFGDGLIKLCGARAIKRGVAGEFLVSRRPF